MFGDSGNPDGPLVEGTNGAIYGVTYFGGRFGSSGTVFQLAKNGSNYYKQIDFGSDYYDPTVAQNPRSGLIRLQDGRLCGVAGAYPAQGSLYQISAFAQRGYQTIFLKPMMVGSMEPALSVVPAIEGRFTGSTTMGATTQPSDSI